MSFVDAYTDFIFIEDQPEQADMIFLPGSAEGALPVRAAQLWKEGYAPLVLPSGKYSKLTGYFTGHGNYETEWDYFHEILQKGGGAWSRRSFRKSRQLILMKMQFSPAN